jgi:hypothetical protein
MVVTEAQDGWNLPKHSRLTELFLKIFKPWPWSKDVKAQVMDPKKRGRGYRDG